MPYIKQVRQTELRQAPWARYEDAGELTYGLYRAAIEQVNNGDFTYTDIQNEIDRYLAGREIKYETYAIVLGCIASCAYELWRQQDKHLLAAALDSCDLLEGFAAKYYRETIALYEDTKIAENGDVLPWQD